MAAANFQAVHPILGVRDLERALDFYVDRLGFALAFRDRSDPDNYAGVQWGGVELHLQWQDEHEMSTIRLRFLVTDLETLYQEYKGKEILSAERAIANTPWGTREFAFDDPDGNALTFYRDLTAEEIEEMTASDD